MGGWGNNGKGDLVFTKEYVGEIFRKLKYQSARRAVACVEAFSGSVDSSLF